MPGSCVVTSQVEEKEGGRWGERKRERENVISSRPPLNNGHHSHERRARRRFVQRRFKRRPDVSPTIPEKTVFFLVFFLRNINQVIHLKCCFFRIYTSLFGYYIGTNKTRIPSGQSKNFVFLFIIFPWVVVVVDRNNLALAISYGPESDSSKQKGPMPSVCVCEPRDQDRLCVCGGRKGERLNSSRNELRP